MYKIFYQPEGHWFGDCMPYCEDGVFYLYHQRDTRNPGPMGEPFGWSLCTTSDFRHYQEHGTAIEHGSNDDQDQYIYAGSVYQTSQDTYTAFYTGANKIFKKKGIPSQKLMQATSHDLINWQKNGNAEQIVPQEGYDVFAWRDPFIVWNDEKEEYLLVLGARAPGDNRERTGRLVSFTSKDMNKWDFQGDFWYPGLFTMIEMPELFKIGEWWYLIVSEFSDKNKMIYRMSRSLDGPWIAPHDDAFDGRAYYAGRTATNGTNRILFGWVPTKENNDDLGNYEWGGTFVPQEVYQRPDYSLGVKPVKSVLDAFCIKTALADVHLQTIDTHKTQVLTENSSTCFTLEATVKIAEGTRGFSIFIYGNELEEAYEYRFSLNEKQLTFDKTPNWPWFQYMNKGLERPINLQHDTEYKLSIIVDDDIAVLYINGTALSVRMYQKPGTNLSFGVTDGDIELTNIVLSKLEQ